MNRGLKSVALFIAFVVIFTLSRHVIHSSSPTTTSVPSTTTPTSTTSTSAPAGSTTTTRPVITTSSCVASDFTGAYSVGPGAAGTDFGSLTLTKKSGPGCTLDGYPVLTVQDKYGAVLHEVVVELPRSTSIVQFPDANANQPARSLAMAVGATASLDLAFSDVPVGNTACENVATISLQFAVHGAALPVTLPYPLTACNGGKFWLSPYYR